MNKVYVVQEVFRKSEKTGDLIPALDLSDAARYGELVILLQPGRVALSTSAMMLQLNQKLADFCDDDFLLPIGDTAAITAAAMEASRINYGRVKLLSWDKRSSQYIPINLSLTKENNYD